MKLLIRDANGNRFDVTARSNKKIKDAEDCDAKLRDKDEEFSADDIKKLKKLIPYLDELVKMLEVDGKTDVDEEIDFEEEDIETDDTSEEIEKTKEKVEEKVEDDVDEDVVEKETEKEVIHDSKSVAKSFGSLKKVRDSKSAETEDIDRDAEIAAAWNKRYGG